MSAFRASFILESIKELKIELLKKNISLVVKIGEPNKVISELLKNIILTAFIFKMSGQRKKIVRKDCY